jgi:hypothetical protein
MGELGKRNLIAKRGRNDNCRRPQIDHHLTVNLAVVPLMVNEKLPSVRNRVKLGSLLHTDILANSERENSAHFVPDDGLHLSHF